MVNRQMRQIADRQQQQIDRLEGELKKLATVYFMIITLFVLYTSKPFVYVLLLYKYTWRKAPRDRASDFFQVWRVEVTHGAKNGGSFSEMMGPSISN